MAKKSKAKARRKKAAPAVRSKTKEPKYRMTAKQAKLVETLAANPNQSIAKAGQQAGYSDRAHTHRALQSPAIRQAMQSHPGLRDSALLARLEEGLDATRPYGKDGDKTGPDWTNRRGFLEIALRLAGHTGAQDRETQVNVAVIIQQERQRRGLHPTENRRIRPGEAIDVKAE